MLRLTILSAAALLLGACASSAPADEAPASQTLPDSNERAVRGAVESFYRALDAMFAGDSIPMEAVWSHEADTTYLPPTGQRLRGWAAIEASWREQAAMRLGGHVEPRGVEIQLLADDLALVVCTEVGTNPGAPGGAMAVRIRSTKLLRPEGGRWVVFFDHVDPLPALRAATPAR